MMSSSKKYVAISVFSLVLIVLALGGYFFKPTYEVEIKNDSENEIIHRLRATPGNNLWLIHINSVEKLPVAEQYEITEDYQFFFSEVIYQAPYVGYLNQGTAKVVAPGTIRISDFSSLKESITFFAGDISKHMMFWNGKWLPLYEGARGGDLICISIKKITGFNIFLKKKVSHDK